MKPSVLAVRSIASEFAFRIYWPVLIILAVIAAVLVGLMVWLIVMSTWWLLLAIPVFIIILAGAVALFVGFVVLKVIAPDQTKQQKKLVKGFVDRIQRLSEITQTPKFILLFRAIRDAISPGRGGLIESVISDTASLTKDYKEIVAAFSD